MKGKILIVDDEASVRELFAGVFGDEGYEVISAEDGNAALNILKDDDIDVIFLDLKLFGMNGIDPDARPGSSSRVDGEGE